MKKIIIGVIVLIALTAIIVALPDGNANADFLRIHIRADSNSATQPPIRPSNMPSSRLWWITLRRILPTRTARAKR